MPEGAGPLVVVYRAEVGDGRAAARGAKISIWAEEPDRLHAEILAPVGGVTFTIDAGGGRLCVVDVARGVAYAGEDAKGALETLVGVPISVGDAVLALLHGVAPQGLSITRAGGDDGALPKGLRIADGERFLALASVRVERGRIDPSKVGTGEPPARLPVRPLTSLEEDLGPRR